MPRRHDRSAAAFVFEGPGERPQVTIRKDFYKHLYQREAVNRTIICWVPGCSQRVRALKPPGFSEVKDCGSSFKKKNDMHSMFLAAKYLKVGEDELLERGSCVRRGVRRGRGPGRTWRSRCSYLFVNILVRCRTWRQCRCRTICRGTHTKLCHSSLQTCPCPAGTPTPTGHTPVHGYDAESR